MTRGLLLFYSYCFLFESILVSICTQFDHCWSLTFDHVRAFYYSVRVVLILRVHAIIEFRNWLVVFTGLMALFWPFLVISDADRCRWRKPKTSSSNSVADSLRRNESATQDVETLEITRHQTSDQFLIHSSTSEHQVVPLSIHLSLNGSLSFHP